MSTRSYQTCMRWRFILRSHWAGTRDPLAPVSTASRSWSWAAHLDYDLFILQSTQPGHPIHGQAATLILSASQHRHGSGQGPKRARLNTRSSEAGLRIRHMRTLLPVISHGNTMETTTPTSIYTMEQPLRQPRPGCLSPTWPKTLSIAFISTRWMLATSP
jgi:hypothetical protein